MRKKYKYSDGVWNYDQKENTILYVDIFFNVFQKILLVGPANVILPFS